MKNNKYKMRNKKGFLISAFSFLLFVSCSQQEFEPTDSMKGSPLAIASAGVAELSTRATITDRNLTEGSIGVFVTSPTGGRYEGRNIKWTYKNGWGLDDATVVLFENNGENQQIAAYYPYVEPDGDDVQITLPDIYGEDYENYDYLYGEYAPLNSNPASITMNHLMSKVTVTVQSTGTEIGDDEVASIALMGVPRTVTWTLPEDRLSGYGDGEEITLYYNGSSYCGYVLPNGAKDITLRVTLETGRVFTANVSLDDAITTDKTEVLTSNTHYRIGLRLGKDKVVKNSVGITPWTEE